MWRTAIIGASLAGVCFSLEVHGADLSKVDRTIGKLPSFNSKQPEFCLLVFGPDAGKRVWLVQDGGVLYIDRNSNGDLTEADEKVASDPKSSSPDEEVFRFRAGDIVDGSLVHKDVEITRFKLDHLRDSDAEVRAALERNPMFRACSVSVDVVMPNQRGSGIEGRVSQSAMAWDERGLLQFSARPADAPIIHFGGPWTVTLAGREGCWHVGRSGEVYLVVGTPGIGPGSTADVAYDKVIPAGLMPKLQVSFPPVGTGESLVKSYDLKRRCCGVNLYGDVAVPDGVGTGKAKIEVSLESWPGTVVASSHHEVEIAPPKPGPKLEPVSPRLVSKLEHEHPKESISGIRFSPDGKRLIGGNYPGCIIHVWDVETGKRLATMDAGQGLRASLNYFDLSPDWKTVFAWHEGKGTFEKFERDGKTLHRVEYHSLVRSWNIDGTPLRTYQHTPPHGIRMMYLAPNGKHFLTLDQVPGEFETHRPRALSLWDTATGECRQVADGNAVPGPFSSDSRRVAVKMPLADDDNYSTSISIFTVPEWKQLCTIPFEGKLTYGSPAVFVGDGKILAGTVRVNDTPKDWQHFSESLKLWDATTGAEVLSIAADAKDEGFGWIKTSPDGKTMVATTFSRLKRGAGPQTPERLLVIDVERKTWNAVEVTQGAVVQDPVFHPDGNWLAASTQVLPAGRSRESPPDELPQPRIELINLATCENMETLVAPQGLAFSMAFSPDGNTLATSGKDAVLLWDFHRAPGAAAAPAEELLGRPMPIVGHTTSGADFNSDDFRGKVMFVDFWATWCRACVAEMPNIKTIYADLHERGLEVVGISLDDEPSVVAQFAKDQDIPWAMLGGNSTDGSGLHHPMAVKYGIETLPATFVLGKDGKVAAVNLRGRALREKIEALLRESK
jgi:WD40 repeat protein